MPYAHVPVMLEEVLQYLNCSPGQVIVDGTLGGAGHAKAILERIVPGGLLIGIDQDMDAIENARGALKSYGKNVHLFQGNFTQISEPLSQTGTASVDGILLDLGVSLNQLKNSRRGFSFNEDAPLDMRMNMNISTTAQDIVNQTTEKGLIKIFRDYGEERWARPIARKIISVRSRKTIRTSQDLADLVRQAVPKKAQYSQQIHPATRVFMALRIAVNQELKRLREFMDMSGDLLQPKGRFCVLAYHSLEDRIVKHEFKQMEKGCLCPHDFPQCICDRKPLVKILTRKAVRPRDEEVRQNPPARSARLRAVEKR